MEALRRWEVLLGLSLIALCFQATKAVKNETTESYCPELKECPFRAQTCSQDEDCAFDSVCCSSPCGKVCTKQLHTGCQTLRLAASRRAKALGVPKKSVRMPRCGKDGRFEPIQCDNEIVSSCWCVDEMGFELPGTRAPAAGLVNCSAPKACAAHTCRMFCPHGFALSDDGCPLCRCRDPCDGVRCPDSLDCQPEELACADPPCPPVPTCKRGRSLNNLCPVGDPLRISDTIRPFLCGNDPGKPTCPPLYQCLVEKGNDYGVCCPASLKIQKTGTCPTPTTPTPECGILCGHDLECPSIQKCCTTDNCGSSCTYPQNVTECYHQRALSELLSVSERAGRGYIPQCTPNGDFQEKQCSRNGLVCWCVDRMGRKIKGSMGPAESTNCTLYTAVKEASSARSLQVKTNSQCEQLECAAVCEYGFKIDENGCGTCKCDDPCEGYLCPEDEECVNVKDSGCTDFLCPTLPVCRPKVVYANPCENGTPLTDTAVGTPITCALEGEDGPLCPESYECTAVAGSTQAVCCLKDVDHISQASETSPNERPQTMCEYLHDFSDSMEGTRDGMNLALPPPTCDPKGDYHPQQCERDNSECWCVDQFGTEIPKTRGNATSDVCREIRLKRECLDLTCRMGCEYGFVLSEETGCPLCQCRDPCVGVSCRNDEQCQMVEVSCKDHYCPPVPACLPKKVGQCPYLVPAASNSCDFECNSDLNCNGTKRCCSNGCGTQCVEPLLLTACQHHRTLAQHQAHESGIPAGKVYIPECKQDGSYASKQCNPGSKECWCVDFRGFELSQTRSSTGIVTCDPPLVSDQCPMYRCKEDCPHGFEMDDKGCRTCKCVDPCSRISCRGEGETCRMVNVECTDWPCPPVPMCLPKKENPCQNGEPLRLGNSDELVTCGPDYEGCPSSHKCQLSPVGEYAVCCPKPRDVCFEPYDEGTCDSSPRNLTRYYFNSKINKCQTFPYSGCKGNHNNFHTEEMCNLVCPVLSQCERLREKNQRAAEKYNKPVFMPNCDSMTGVWLPVQCMTHVGVCWCVTPQGEPLKGTLTRGAEPECNFRQARGRGNRRGDFTTDADLVLEELMMQIGSFDGEEEPEDLDEMDVGTLSGSRCEALGAQCDNHGKFLPTQCEEDVCWCVDEAGNQLPQTNTFKRGEQICLPTPVESVEVTLGFRGEYDEVSSQPVISHIKKIISGLKGMVSSKGMDADTLNDVLYLRFSLIGSNKVDVAYKLEQMVTQQRLPGLTADITRSRFVHRLGTPAPLIAERVVALEHREIVSQSPVSVVAPYHTALIVVAAASAFIISVLMLLVVLYKRKMNSLNNAENKVVDDNERFLAYATPVYVELPSEKIGVEKVAVKGDGS